MQASKRSIHFFTAKMAAREKNIVAGEDGGTPRNERPNNGLAFRYSLFHNNRGWLASTDDDVM